MKIEIKNSNLKICSHAKDFKGHSIYWSTEIQLTQRNSMAFFVDFLFHFVSNQQRSKIWMYTFNKKLVKDLSLSATDCYMKTTKLGQQEGPVSRAWPEFNP